MCYKVLLGMLLLSSSAFAAAEYPVLDCPLVAGDATDEGLKASIVLTSPKHALVAKLTNEAGEGDVEIPCFGRDSELNCQTFDGASPISGNGWSFTVRKVASETLAVAHRYADRLGTKTYVFTCQKSAN